MNNMIVSPAVNHTYYEKVEEGHVLLRSWLFDEYCQGKNKQDSELDGPDLDKKYYVDNIAFPKEDEVSDYRAYIKGNEQRLGSVSKCENIGVKNPKKWIKGISGPNTWNNRLLEWYTAEERLIFVAKTEKDCNMWIRLLNWLKYKNADF